MATVTENLSDYAVDELYASMGIGTKIVSYLLDKAIKMKLKQVFVLTTQAMDWFSSLGFKKSDITDLPKQRQEKYDKKRNSLVLVCKFSQSKRRI